MTIIRKIQLSIWLVVVFMLIYAALMVYSIAVVGKNSEDQRTKSAALNSQISVVKLSVAKQMSDLRGELLVESMSSTSLALDKNKQDAVAALTIIREQLKGDEVKITALNDIEKKISDFNAIGKQVAAKNRAGDKAGALNDLENSANPLGTTLTGSVDKLAADISAEIAQKELDNDQTTNLINAIIVIVFVLSLAITIVVAIWMPRSVGRQLREVIARLSTSTSEMLSITSQVASGSIQTATAISEAATTVDEVRQTTLLSSQKATAVSDSAQAADEVADAGRQAVVMTMEGIQRIQEQMAVVADSVVRLSEQTEAVGEIIATSNDLAEQSNLLSVNAAIEAAKASERGKGFGVVAEEIKNLAGQSKQAVVQVRSILNDIQKATSQAVMATEQSGKAIEEGARQAMESSQAIESLSESVALAAQSAVQIVASSQQELVGMDQISEAMQSIDSASSQNAVGAKQIETEVQHLQELAESLRRMVEPKRAE